jgi:Leucyl aminopeptidase (aminopeptidase T)
MTDQRIETLARNLLGYSLEIKAGDRIFIEGETGSEPLVRGLLEEAYRMGAVPSFEVIDHQAPPDLAFRSDS